MKKGFVVLAIVVLLSIIPTLALDISRSNVNVSAKHTSLADAANRSVIMNNVYIGPVDVSGLSEDAANAKVQECIDNLRSKKLTVNIADKKDTVPIQDLSLTWTNTNAAHEAASIANAGNVIERFKAIHDIESSNYIIELERTIDESMVRGFVAQEAEAHNVAAVDATLKFNDDGELYPVEGTDGMVINENASLMNIVTYLTHTWNGEEPVCDIKCDVIASSGDVEELAKVKDVIGYYATDFSSSGENRYQNVKNGTSKINGYLLNPGDSFSVLDHLAPFTEENGYALAASYLNGQVEDSLGGGICQVSTTLYNAVLRAELQVDQRSPHSMLVSYVEPSMDAAIAEGSKDFIFTNNLEHPIYICAETDDGVLTVIIYGVEERDPDREISFSSEVLSTTEAKVELMEDVDHELGYVEQISDGHQGVEAVLWKTITQGGQSETVQVNSSEYEVQNIKYAVGISSGSSEAVRAMENAIASNDLEKVYQVLDSYS